MFALLSLLLTCLHTSSSAIASDILIRGRSPNPAIADRAVCNSDNVLRALQANRASATPFCSSFIDIPVSTIFKSVAGVKATTTTITTTRTSTIISNFLSPLPTYVSQYSTSQVSSACSCLSVPTSTETYTASTSTLVSRVTPPNKITRSKKPRDISKPFSNDPFVYTTYTATGACATGTIYPGAHLVTGQFADAYNLNLGSGFTPYDCCHICNSDGGQGPFASCVGWSLHGGNCTSVLEGGPYADYMQPPCTHEGLQPATIYVDKAKYPGDVGGEGAVCGGGEGCESGMRWEIAGEA
ncbi:MAG: hypothetical protein Q9220_007403 [cf. Caloplaca sp. 1 TL-2023]